MTFSPEKVDAFLSQFDESAPEIRAFPGCLHLELWRDIEAPAVFTTYSHWKNEEALDEYRNSNLFRTTWAEVKPWFSAAPVAHSYTVSRSAGTIGRANSEPRDANE